MRHCLKQHATTENPIEKAIREENSVMKRWQMLADINIF